MIGWLRRMFGPRDPDGQLPRRLVRLQAVQARRSEHVDATAAHAGEVATAVIRDSRQYQLRASFARVGGRLSR